MDLNAVKFERDENVAILRFNRPKQKNALDIPMRREIAEVISAVNLDETIRALIVVGSEGSFCAGGDIASMQNRRPGAESGRLRIRDNFDWVQELINLDRPVIAAVDGPALGVGFTIALAADFILATPRAKFSLSFARMGLVPDAGGLYQLPRIVGLQRAKEIVYSGRIVAAEEALSLGIAYEIHESEALEKEAMSLAKKLSNASPASIALSKGILNGTFQSDLRNVLEMEAMANGICFESDFHKEAVSRFLKKEPAEFSGLGR